MQTTTRRLVGLDHLRAAFIDRGWFDADTRHGFRLCFDNMADLRAAERSVFLRGANCVRRGLVLYVRPR